MIMKVSVNLNKMTTASFPPVDDALKFLEDVNYKKLFTQIVIVVATVCAIIVGVIKYAMFMIRYWYEDGGKQKLVNFYQSIKLNTNRLIDSIYYSTNDQ